jgi:hypothetical protein
MWGDMMVGYRKIAYDFDSNRRLSDLSFGGPLVGVRCKL